MDVPILTGFTFCYLLEGEGGIKQSLAELGGAVWPVGSVKEKLSRERYELQRYVDQWRVYAALKQAEMAALKKELEEEIERAKKEEEEEREEISREREETKRMLDAKKDIFHLLSLTGRGGRGVNPPPHSSLRPSQSSIATDD